jgi:hypothetical protein
MKKKHLIHFFIFVSCIQTVSAQPKIPQQKQPLQQTTNVEQPQKFSKKNITIKSPVIHFSPGYATKVFGSGSQEARNGVLNCNLLVNQVWPFPNAQVSPVCLEATISCVRFGLFVKGLEKSPEARLAQIQQSLIYAQNEVNAKLLGCVLALEGTVDGTLTLPQSSGY